MARFATVKPGRVPWPESGMQAPHINVSIFARGVLNRLRGTRVYFDGDPALQRGSGLKLVEPARRATLIAKREGGVWHLPIHLGGPNETVFFDVSTRNA